MYLVVCDVLAERDVHTGRFRQRSAIRLNDHVITDAQQITADWLTAALARNGVLRAGRVRNVGADAEKSVWSQIVRLRPRYGDDAVGELPGALLLKICAGDDAVFG